MMAAWPDGRRLDVVPMVKGTPNTTFLDLTCSNAQGGAKAMCEDIAQPYKAGRQPTSYHSESQTISTLENARCLTYTALSEVEQGVETRRGTAPRRERDYCLVRLTSSPAQIAKQYPLVGLEHCTIPQCPDVPSCLLWTQHQDATGAGWTRHHDLCPAHTAPWCTAHQVDLGAIPTIAFTAWRIAWEARAYDQVPWFRYTAPVSAPAAPVPPPAPATSEGEEEKVLLSMAVFVALKKHQPCTNAAVAKALDKPRNRTHTVLPVPREARESRQKGQTYRVVDPPEAQARTQGHARSTA